uniref:NIF system FeS cluster assembly NifU N-terminal domain-containing protein n=1 Tax=Balaenoptera musculus TaxID=9771 RepID=A0A8C0CBN3_BALMU
MKNILNHLLSLEHSFLPHHRPGSLQLENPFSLNLNIFQQASPARLYHKKVVDHYENPPKVGFLDKTSKNVGTRLIKADEKRKMVNGRFKTFGCGSAIASSSSASKCVKGKTVEEATTIKNTGGGELCLPPVKLYCSMIAKDAIKVTLADYKLKQEPKKGEAEKK